jgi:hypothetical protein
MSIIPNPNFESSTPNGQFYFWRPVNFPQDVTFGVEHVVNDPAARNGASYAVARTTVAGGSIAYDFNYASTDINTTSLTALAWLRTRPGSPSLSVQMTFWDLVENQATKAEISVGQTWQLETCARIGRNSPNNFRIEFYINTPNQDLLIDSVNVF